MGVPLLGLLSLLADIVYTSNQLFILSLELDFGIPSNHSGNMQGKDLGGKPGKSMIFEFSIIRCS